MDNTIGIILAGGKGTRMGNFTLYNHKCLLKVGNFPILTHLITQLSFLGIHKIVICTGYLSEKIKFYVRGHLKNDFKRLLKNKNIKFIYYPEVYINKTNINDSTSQRIFKAKKVIGRSDLLLLYGDSLVNINPIKFKSFLQKNKSSDIILTVSNPKERFGIVKLKKDKVISFSEKNYDKSKWVNSGWMLLKNKTLKKIKNTCLNFENYIFTKDLEIRAFKNYFYYLPIDNISDLKVANIDWKTNKKNMRKKI